jgi:hypothetical protein
LRYSSGRSRKVRVADTSCPLYGTIPLGYGSQAMWFRIDLLVRADVDDEALHEVQLLANTYAIVDIVEATRDPGSGDPRFTARIDAPSAEAALGSLLTVIGQTSGHAGLAEESSLRRVTIEREEWARHESGSSNA